MRRLSALSALSALTAPASAVAPAVAVAVAIAVAVVVAVAACSPKVDPRSPFDEDDPRSRAARDAQAAAATAAASSRTEPPSPPAPTGPAVREGSIERAVLLATLDAQPGELLQCFEVAAVENQGKFAGWRLVRFIRSCGERFSGIDLVVGDVLVSVNGRVLVKPTDLADLWAELYKADVIVAEMRRGPSPFVLRFDVVPPLASTSSSEPVPPPP
ncbi:MAG TPA: hypothetical protein VM261_09640 [Kofleriaceae bacterium]|nr:hypothetical protein [Kofleriaceae bacterium]